MASGVTDIGDVVVPKVFSPYVQQLTEEKSRLIQSGAVVPDARLAQVLAGGGLTFNEPSFRDLDNDVENVSTDNPSVHSTPNKIQTSTEIQVRLSRNNSWSSMDLAGDLAGADPMGAIANRVAAYWTRRLQIAFIATILGNFAENDTAAPANGTQYDMTHDVSASGVFADGVTNFSAEAFIDATLTMGDSMDDLALVFMHSVVYGRAQKNNLIDFIPDSEGRVNIPTFLGRQVIVDDSLPNAAGVFQTWLFGRGAVRFGSGTPKVPTAVERIESAGSGGGQEVLYNRTEWILHPVGNAYAASPPNGGPSNGTSSTDLGHADSWVRVFPERKQIKIARLLTTEY